MTTATTSTTNLAGHGPVRPGRGHRPTTGRVRRGALAAAAAVIGLTGCVATGSGGSGARSFEDGAPLLIVGDSNTAAASSWAADVTCADATWAKSGLGLVNRTGQAGPALRDRIGEVMAHHRGYRVVVMLGTNDMLGPPPSTAGYQRIADDFRAEGATTVRFAVPPPVGPGHWATTRMTQGWARWKAAVLATPGAVDFVHPLGDRLDPAEQHGDGIHLNQTAQRRVGRTANGMLC